MDFAIEVIFLLVFFVPMGLMVVLNVLLHRSLPDIAAPWARLAAPAEAPEPLEPYAAPVPLAAKEAEVSNDEEALEAA